MIRLTRVATFSDGLRSYSVICNRTKVTEIKSGETIFIDLPEGPVELYLKLDWCRSKKLVLHNGSGTTDLVCSSSLKGWRILMAPVYASILFTRYIKLIQAESPLPQAGSH